MTSCTPLCTSSATNTPGAGPGTVASCPIRDAGETGRPLPLGRDHTGNRNTMPARLVRATFPSASPRPSGRCAGRFSLSPAFSPAEIGTAAACRVPGGPARTEQREASGAPSRFDGSPTGGWPMR